MERNDCREQNDNRKCPFCGSAGTTVITDENKKYLYCTECGYSCCFPS